MRLPWRRAVDRAFDRIFFSRVGEPEEWADPGYEDLRFGPGVAFPYTEREKAKPWPLGSIWRCPLCAAWAPAGQGLPFMHRGDCPPGTMLEVASSWTIRRWQIEDDLNAAGVAAAALEWDWPGPYDGPQRRAWVRIRRKARDLEALWRASRSPLAHYRPSGVTT